jgi:hypothetical protein
MGTERRPGRFTAYEFGHPRSVTIETLEKKLTGTPRPSKLVGVALGVRRFDHRNMKAPIYATGWDGDVVVTLGADGTYEVATQGQ